MGQPARPSDHHGNPGLLVGGQSVGDGGDGQPLTAQVARQQPTVEPTGEEQETGADSGKVPSHGTIQDLMEPVHHLRHRKVMVSGADRHPVVGHLPPFPSQLRDEHRPWLKPPDITVHRPPRHDAVGQEQAHDPFRIDRGGIVGMGSEQPGAGTHHPGAGRCRVIDREEPQQVGLNPDPVLTQMEKHREPVSTRQVGHRRCARPIGQQLLGRKPSSLGPGHGLPQQHASHPETHGQILGGARDHGPDHHRVTPGDGPDLQVRQLPQPLHDPVVNDGPSDRIGVNRGEEVGHATSLLTG